jgi:hypothetical protein
MVNRQHSAGLEPYIISNGQLAMPHPVLVRLIESLVDVSVPINDAADHIGVIRVQLSQRIRAVSRQVNEPLLIDRMLSRCSDILGLQIWALFDLDMPIVAVVFL